jgi:hypothetical protein
MEREGRLLPGAVGWGEVSLIMFHGWNGYRWTPCSLVKVVISLKPVS